MHFFLFALICMIWGSSFILMKKAALAFGPFSIAAWGVVGGAIVMWTAWKLRRQGPWPLKRSHWAPLLFVALIGNAWPYTVQPYLVPQLGSGFIGLMVSFVPLLTILVSMPMLGVYPTKRQLLGVLGGLACMGVIVADKVKYEATLFSLGLALTVPLVYAISNTFVKRTLSDVPPLALTCGSLTLSSMILLPLGLSLETVDTGENLGLALVALVGLGVLGRGVAGFIFYKLIQERGPLFAGMVAYLIPVGALLWGWLDKEVVSAVQLAALVGLLAMVAIVQTADAGQPAPIPESVPD